MANPTKVLSASDDHLLTNNGFPSHASTPLDLAVGFDASWPALQRALIKFNMDWAGVGKIVKAELYLRVKSTSVTPIVQGSSPGVTVERLTAAFNTSTDYPGPSHTGVGNVTDNGLSIVALHWTPIDITDIFEAWTPAYIQKRDGSPGDGLTNYGIWMASSSEGGPTHNWIVYSLASGGSDPYILLEYTNNAPPDITVPKVNGAVSGSTVVGASAPTLTATVIDPDGDAITGYQIDVDATTGNGVTPDWASPAFSVTQATPHSSLVGTTITRVLTGVTTRGQWYCARIRATDAASGYGPYVYIWFYLNTLISVTLSEPSATGRLAKLEYVAGSGWTTPRLRVTWNFSPRQTQYELDVKTDNAGNPTGATITSGQIVSTAYSVLVAANLTENTRYHVRVRVFDGIEWSAYSGYFIVRARWGLATHRKDISIGGAAPTTIEVTTLTTTTDPAKNAVVIEYNSSDDGTTNLAATWLASIASIVKRKWVHYRVWLLAWGTSPGTTPSLDKLVVQATGNVLQPDQWLPSPISGVGASIELGDRVFGTQSLRIDGNGTSRVVYQAINVMPGIDYVLQARVRSTGASGAYVGLSDTPSAAGLVTQTPVNAADSPWELDKSPVWNSGGRSSVYVICVVTGAAGTTGYFDGLKVERGLVASPWTSGTVAQPAVLDSAGVQVDAAAGGIVRLRGSTGGVRDRVDLGASGLLFGGDTEVASPVTGVLTIGGTALASMPIGMGGLWFTDTPPTGFLLCQGQSVLRADYPALFTLWGTFFGSVDGTHFTLPDLRQRFPLGKAASGTGATLGGTGGQIDHDHAGTTAANAAGTEAAGSGLVRATTHTHTFTTDTENPPYFVVNFAVRAL